MVVSGRLAVLGCGDDCGRAALREGALGDVEAGDDVAEDDAGAAEREDADDDGADVDDEDDDAEGAPDDALERVGFSAIVPSL